ncbi:hypothetical protein E4T44_05087 [Aureobasidium sp. EXF-8845]|nr:hypothetical protein E4T44_05087 [Aureobasidium sp. EXF-8845]KAI4851660.1 hypothetical protein E4T45_04991 [Aureobasidium sp. EXF-8846]
MFNDAETASKESSRESPSSRSTTVPKRARVNDLPDGKGATKQRLDTTTTVVTSRPKSSNATSVLKKSQPSGVISKAAVPKDRNTEGVRNEIDGSSSKPQPLKLVKLSTAPSNLAPRGASDVTSAATLNAPRDGANGKDTPAANTINSNVAVARDRLESAPQPAPKIVGPARRGPINMFTEPKAKPRQRQRVNEYTPKDSTDPQFVSLRQMGKIQRYSHNEPPPDPNALTFIDPTTGKTTNGADGNSSTSDALRLDTNVTRISEAESSADPRPSSALSRRSTSMSGFQREALQGRPPTVNPWSAQGTEPRFAYPSARTNLPYLSRKQLTCRFWLRGTCKKSEEECPYAHTWTGQMAPKSALVCQYWAKGRCKHSDEQCEYHHTHDFQRNIDGARREGCEDVNDFYAAQQARRRSESPDRYGLRQDEAEGRRSRVDLPHLKTRPDERTPIQSPSLASTTSIEPRRDIYTHHMEDTAVDDTTMDDTAMDNLVNMAPAQIPTVAMPGAMTLTLIDKDTAEPLSTRLSISPASQPTSTMDVKLVFDTKASRVKFLDAIGEKPTLESSEICRSRDFEAYWFSKDKAWASGGVICTPGDTVATYLEDYLVLHSSCIAIRDENFTFIVYPTQNPDWQFMPSRGPDRSGLRWYLQAAVPDTLESIIIKPSRSSFISMCAEHLELNPEVLFAGNRGKQVEKIVYLFFPEGTLETKLVEVFLNEAGAKFVHSEDCDLWNQFCGKGLNSNRVILFHPLMHAFWKVPEFWNVLTTGHSIFQIGVSKSVKPRPDSPFKYNCKRLFPSGSLTLLTDGVFKHDPAHAYQVLKIYEGHKIKPEGGRTDRIFCRPGILAWLAELIDEDREQGTLTEDSPRIKCWQLVCELLSMPVADNNRNPFRSDMRVPHMLYSPPKSEMPSYGPLWDSSEEEATEFLVNWFAGHAIQECENYRRFNVLYEQHTTLSAQTPGLNQPDNPKDPKQWMQKYTHLKITTPARFVVQVQNYEKSKNALR